MITEERYGQGRSIREICRLTGLSRNTVRRYLREPVRRPAYWSRPGRPGKLEPYNTAAPRSGDSTVPGGPGTGVRRL